ncbi:FAD-dependent monooxygenase [Shewanella sp. NIFS-20-20]|uniref:FAD-dependent monooxygenase n=1 Tax=Shewanella sp. NIFS-20-20 TaxID=2853806 RepID=UPI001C463C64|nr:FAD-dependent monooxygenase [Shewanella sp. NIFS-20-20]
MAIQRGVLQQLLIETLNTQCIQLNKKVVDVNWGSCQSSLTFSDGTFLDFDAVIGADGIHSVVRNTLFDDSLIRHAQQTCWRGISSIQLPQEYQHQLNELWGAGTRFGFVRLTPNEVYWYGLHSSHLPITSRDLIHCFKKFHPIVSDIISQTPTDNVFQSDVCDLRPIASWSRDTVCLLGDAAHATTPNMGQGACQAIEDAYTLSYYLSQYPIMTAFAKYECLRKNKTVKVVKLSWQLGNISHIKNPALATIRNAAMRAIPNTYNLNQVNKIYKLASF